MEQLFAVRVLVHYHDKSNVDHAAVRRLISAAGVDSLRVLLADGSSVTLFSYIQTQPAERTPILEITGSAGSSLTQVASVFMLAEARAAADALPSSPHELETACSALERLLGCLATKRPLLPVRDVKQSARVKFGTAARRRAALRLSGQGSDPNQEVSILKAVNAVLRLCDVATHCLAVVSRQSVASKSSCETAVALSARLLTLAASLYEVQKDDTTPALSFFSSNSLRTALVAGAMHLGSIAIEHLEIEPMTWIHVANRIVMSSSTSIAPRTSVLSALFGGMIKAGKRYESSERDTKAAESAVCLLSTLHVVLETDIVRESQFSDVSCEGALARSAHSVSTVSAVLTLGTGAISQAARSFLGERVVAAEEDGDEGRIAARTVYQACEEYAERAGESDGMMGLLSRLFACAGGQCRLESAEDSIVSIPESALACPPDESDASSDGPHARPESPPFTLDIFDQRSRDGFGASATIGSCSEAGVEHLERTDLHREIGALALDTLAHWVSRAQNLGRYSEMSLSDLAVNTCKSASMFSFSNSSASYDLRAGMLDFGSLIAPIIAAEINENTSEEKDRVWKGLVGSLVRSCSRMNPIMRSVLSLSKNSIIVRSLIGVFLNGSEDPDLGVVQNADGSSSLPVEGLLVLILSLISEANGLEVVQILASFVRGLPDERAFEIPLPHRVSVIILLSHALLVTLGIDDESDTARIALVSLFNRDVDGLPDPVFPTHTPELEKMTIPRVAAKCSSSTVQALVKATKGVSQAVDKFCYHPNVDSWEAVVAPSIPRAADLKEEKQLYHAFWACLMLHKSLSSLGDISGCNLATFVSPEPDSLQFPKSTPFVCMKALESDVFNSRLREALRNRKHPSLTLLCTAECLAMIHPQRGRCSQGDPVPVRLDMNDLFVSVVQSVIDISSELTFKDTSANFKAFFESFSSLSVETIKESTGSCLRRLQSQTDMSKPEACFTCLQTAMSYVRAVSSGQTPLLLSSAMASATELLEYLSFEQLSESKGLLLDAARLVLFLPKAFATLNAALYVFLKRSLSLLFRLTGDSSDVDDLVFLMARVTGFSKVIEQGSSSAGMHLMCQLTEDLAQLPDSEALTLRIGLLADKVPARFGNDVSIWLNESLSKLSLGAILSKLFVPREDSAVTVSAHARSVSLLMNACEKSSLWTEAVLRGWNDCIQEPNDRFAVRTVRRSVMQSATMNDSVIALLEKVVTDSRSHLVPEILRYVFEATCHVLEREPEITLEGRVRLFSFAVRVAILYRRNFSKVSHSSSPRFLEPMLFTIIVDALEMMTSNLRENPENAQAKQVVLFLCGLIDCFLAGMYGSRSPYLSRASDMPQHKPGKASSSDGTGSARETEVHLDEEEKNSADSDGNDSSQTEESMRTALCTYTSTGSQFVEQHWYFCYSCELVGSEGVCSVCARVCHKGCELAYSKFSRFFCDCGAGSDSHEDNTSNPISASEDGDGGNGASRDGLGQGQNSSAGRKRKSCNCLKSPRRREHPLTTHQAKQKVASGPSASADLLSATHLREVLIADLKSLREQSKEGDEELFLVKKIFEDAMKKRKAVKALIQSGLYILRELDSSCEPCYYSGALQPVNEIQTRFEQIQAECDFRQTPESGNLAQCTRVLKSGAVDTTGLSSEGQDSCYRSALSYSTAGNVLAVGHKAGYIEFFDASELATCVTGPVDKSAVAEYPRASVSFDILSVKFHPENPNMLLAFGTEKLVILCRTQRNGSCEWKQYAIELGLTEFEGFHGRNALLDVSWIEGGRAHILVTTTGFVKIFDASVDTFCPQFFATAPKEEAHGERVTSEAASDASVSETERQGQHIVTGAIAVPFDLGNVDGPSEIYVLLLSSDLKLFISATHGRERESRQFIPLFDVKCKLEDGRAASTVSGLSYHPADSVITVTFESGDVLCVCMALDSNENRLTASILWARFLDEAVTSGTRTDLVPIPGRKVRFLFCRRGETLKGGGVLLLNTRGAVQVQTFSGSPSASVLGVTAYAASTVAGASALDGGFLLLDDGSLHRVDVLSEPARAQVSQEEVFMGIVERQRVRSMKSSRPQSDTRNGYNDVPEAVGFFEKCRLVADQVSVERLSDEENSDGSFERMSVTLAGGGGDCVVSSRENEPFKFGASIENRSVVLVGARLRFGGTDRSRSRVPSEVKVFGRAVKWRSQNGVKRWLDIPFSVPESTESPQKVTFELTPRRPHEESRGSCDGLVAIDALELYAVSSIEFTERKLMYEKERSKHFDRLKDEKDSSKERSANTLSELLTTMSRSSRTDPSRTDPATLHFSQDQAALLTTLKAIHGMEFEPAAESDVFLLELNNLWSAVFEGSPSRDPNFLAHLLKPCLSLYVNTSESESDGVVSSSVVELSVKGIQGSVEATVELLSGVGMLQHINSIEKSLFAVAGVARALLVSGCAVQTLNASSWLKRHRELMPGRATICRLVRGNEMFGIVGRSLQKSAECAATNIADICVVESLRDVMAINSEQHASTEPSLSRLLVRMLTSMDQLLRLCIAQRLLDVFDSPEHAAEVTVSPFETILVNSLKKRYEGLSSGQGPTTPDLSEEPGAGAHDLDSSQRWAYRCDSCGEVCDQEWWHCENCEDFDLCTACLRRPANTFHGGHNENHMLLRGSVTEDSSDLDTAEGSLPESPDILLDVQGTLKPLVDEFLRHMFSERRSADTWRFIEGAEVIAQIISPNSPRDLRKERLKVFFSSSFTDVLRQMCEQLGDNLESTCNDYPGSRKLPKSSESLYLLLRVLCAAKGSITPVYLHGKGIPAMMYALLEKMHRRLQLLFRALSSACTPRSIETDECGLMSWSTWNHTVPGLRYDILQHKPRNKHCVNDGGLFRMNNELGVEDSVVVNLLLAMLDILEYSFKSAASATLSKQMRRLPRNVLCHIIVSCESACSHLHDKALLKDVAAAATRLLSALEFDDRNTMNNTLDKYKYEEQGRRLEQAMREHDAILNYELKYDTTIEVASILDSLHRAAERHPATWRNYVIEHEQILWHILLVAQSLNGQVQVNALQLLASAVAVSSEVASRAIRGHSIVDLDQVAGHILPESSDVQECSEEISGREKGKGPLSVPELLRSGFLNRQVSLTIFRGQGYRVLDVLVHQIMLSSQNRLARLAASQTLTLGIARATEIAEKEEFVSAIHNALLKGIELMPYAGDMADGLMGCVRFFIVCCQKDLFGIHSESFLASLAVSVTTLLRERCTLLVSHPNARLYERLSSLLEIDGYYLESDPCMSCSASICDASERKECRLDTIRAETKYTANSIMHRLLSVHEVSAVSVKVIDPRRSRRAKTINVLYSSRSVSDAAELKSAEHPWRILRALDLGPTASEARVDLVVPVAAANIKFEFADFHNASDLIPLTRDGQQPDTSAFSGTSPTSRRSSSSVGANENLQCPRCSRSVTDRHGICRNCHENAYQCRQCRNINYENLDGFLCNECGYCKHGRFEFSLTGRLTCLAERVANEEDRKRASKIIEKETGNVHRCMDQLIRMRSSIIRSLSSGVPTEETKEKTKLLGSARIGLADLLDSVAPRTDIAVLEALLEGQTSHEIEEAANSTQGGISITEDVIAESSGSADPSEREQNNPTSSSVASPVNRANQSRAPVGDSSVVSKTATALSTTYSKDCRSVYSTMSRGIRVLTLTRAELVRYANTVGGSRLQYANDIARETNLDDADDANFPPSSEKKPGELWSSRSKVCCYGCTQSFISKCVRLVKTIMRRESPAAATVQNSDLAKTMMLVCSLCEKPDVRGNIRELITYLVNDNLHATQLVCRELARKIEFCIDSFETVDSHSVARFEMAILEATATLDDSCWEERLRLVFRLLFKCSSRALTCSSVAESIILPCLRVALRLMRADSELTILENASGMEGYDSATDAVSHDAPPLQASENSETENDDIEQTRQAVLTHAVRDMDMPVAGGLDVNDQVSRTAGTDDPMNLLAMAQGVLHERSNSATNDMSTTSAASQSRPDDRRQPIPRSGSDFMSGSGAPSSIGTANDGHISDDEVNGHAEEPGAGIDIRVVSSLLENDHDSKLLSADVSRWLEGRFDQTSWIAEMMARSTKCDQRQVGGALPETPSQSTYLKSLFQAWKRKAMKNREIDPAGSGTAELESHNLKRLSIEKDNWIVRLMLFTPCATVRKEACALLELLCGQEEALQLQLLDVLTGPALSLGADVGEKSKEYFDLLESTLSSRSHRLYLIAKGFLPKLAGIIRSRAERLILSEANARSSLRLVSFLEGYSLKRLVSLLRQTLEVVPSQRTSLRENLFKVGEYKLVWSLQRAYICMRKLISLRTRLTDDCGAQLCEVLLSKEFLFAGPTVSAVVSACVSELKAAKHRDDAQAIGILLEQLCQMLCPERKEPVCFLSLSKAPTQEEFIRGTMSRNPYPSSAFDGPLMRDVKNKICKDLDLPGLLEDDFAMELLVAGNLVKLDLPIMGVYDHVWRGSTAAMSSVQPTHITRAFGLRRASPSQPRGNGSGSRNLGMRSTIFTFRRVNTDRDSSEEDGRGESRSEPPMSVIYRLSGLDGEATEPIVDSLPTEINDDEDVEELYGDTILFGEVGGLDVLFELLAIVGSWGDDAETAVRAPALRLLRASCEVAQNRALLAKSTNAVRTLLDCAASAFEHAQGSHTAVISAESLLIAAEQILAQQRKELENSMSAVPNSVNVSSDDPDEVLSRVQVFLGRLTVATWPKAENSILHLLPFLIQGVPAAITVVLEYFHFSCDSIDSNVDDQRKAKQLGTVVFATPNDMRGDTFAQETIRTGIGLHAVSYVAKKFPLPRSSYRAQWDTALERPGPPLILRLLTGLSRFLGLNLGRQGACEMLREILKKQPSIIPVLCQLEMAVSDNAIGTSAEELLEALARDEGIERDIRREREAIRKARREAASASRTAILRESGLGTMAPLPDRSRTVSADEDKGESSVDMGFVHKLIEELPDEVGPACVVCGDGFRCRPEDALAFYVFSRKVPLDLSVGTQNTSAKTGSDVMVGSVQGSSRVELEFWSAGRGRSSSGLPSRSASNSCYTTVTHLNAIHLACHKEAARVDRTSRRDEWDGASLRNSQTRCNNLFPVRPPAAFKAEDAEPNEEGTIKSAKMSYSAAVDGYFGRLSSLGRTSLSPAKGVTYDLGRSLLRFADGGTSIFSEHSRGGGPHSNACLIPHLVQLAIYMIEVTPQRPGENNNLFANNAALKTQEAALTKFLMEDEVGDVTYYLASAVMLQPLSNWNSSLVRFARKCLRDKALRAGVVFRLIAFCDLVNLRLKDGVETKDGQHWLDALRRHIGIDETFGLEFGNTVNDRWETYVRHIDDEESFVQGLVRNLEVSALGGRSESVTEEMKKVLAGAAQSK